jgi:hypothetical protein
VKIASTSSASATNVAIKHDFYYRGARVEGLVGLYRRIGVHDFDWHDFGPAPTEMAWQYHTFDPPEKHPWDSAQDTRYRKVTFPAGMENWFGLDFDPAKHGWKTGLQPFGATNGKLVGGTIDGSRTSTKPSGCRYDFCRHHEPMKTLWDKEVLLMRGKFRFPEFKDGYRYRFVIGGMSHVGAGEGYKVYRQRQAVHRALARRRPARGRQADRQAHRQVLVAGLRRRQGSRPRPHQLHEHPPRREAPPPDRSGSRR